MKKREESVLAIICCFVVSLFPQNRKEASTTPRN